MSLANQFMATLAANIQSDILNSCLRIDYISLEQIKMIDNLDVLITKCGFGLKDFQDVKEFDLGSFHGRMKFYI